MPHKLCKISALSTQRFGGDLRKTHGGCITPPPSARANVNPRPARGGGGRRTGSTPFPLSLIAQKWRHMSTWTLNVFFGISLTSSIDVSEVSVEKYLRKWRFGYVMPRYCGKKKTRMFEGSFNVQFWSEMQTKYIKRGKIDEIVSQVLNLCDFDRQNFIFEKLMHMKYYELIRKSECKL